jgi:glucoamylase
VPSGLSDLERSTYLASVMVLAASEDKINRGAFVASPTMPWIWGTTKIEKPSGAYHLVWSRDLYEIATALIADGDTAAANRALTFLFTKQQEADGHFPQNSLVTGAEHWTNIQLDETADPIVLAWQLGHRDATTWTHVKKAADYLLNFVDPKTGLAAPYTQQERWENQSGYSPATIASLIAGLVCAADIARANGDTASADRYLAKADAWRAQVKSLTVTTNGPLSTKPYFLRLTKDGNPNAGTTYSVGDSGPTYDQRAVVDPSFLELVRLGVLRADDPDVVNTLTVVDQQLWVTTPNGQFWHRYNGDGYGEQKNGAPWDFGFPDGSQTTIGRAWPIFAGERGEYELTAGMSAAARLTAMAKSGNDGRMLSEQVWDQNPPSGTPGFPAGEGTFSATPLIWTHAQFVRLAQSIAAGRPVETPYVVACRYVGCPR